ncbi:hypothetical protein BCR39DRAFT_598954 [Naematelia encephala]|uniref:Uncharacterized protein n=1 Tax=Naematelia encephala TaxID=71784 RepID=A0A1Y2B3C0_9TREE|nr:hypothetical protein BCR39DRAFT_598954 [Naematelia encephala]
MVASRPKFGPTTPKHLRMDVNLRVPRWLPPPWTPTVERALARARNRRHPHMSQLRIPERQTQAITNHKEGYLAKIRFTLTSRENNLNRVSSSEINKDLYDLLCLAAQTLSLPVLKHLAQIVRLAPCRHKSIIDDQGNPYSTLILIFVDCIIVLLRQVPTIPLAQLEQIQPVDKRAFAAFTAASLASRIMMSIPLTHEYILRAMWFALIYLDMGYRGSKRGVAVEFLLERVVEQLMVRKGDDVWMGRMRRIMRQHGKSKTADTALDLRDIWIEMNGFSGLSE